MILVFGKEGQLAKELDKRCNKGHIHQPLTGDRARLAAEYPTGLCRAICKGLMNQIRMEEQRVRPLMMLRHTDKVHAIQGGGVNKVDDRHDGELEEAPAPQRLGNGRTPWRGHPVRLLCQSPHRGDNAHPS